MFTPAIVLLISTANAWSIKTDEAGNELYWETAPIDMVVNPEGMTAVDAAAVRDGVEGAVYDFYAADGSPIEFNASYDTNGPRTVNYEDNINAIFFTDGWTYEGLDPTLLALTYTWYMDGGQIVGFDMAINLENHDWATQGEEGLNDLHNTLTHELGHAVGLAHSDDEAASMYASTYAGELTKRGLSEDDIAGLLHLYEGMDFDTEPAQPFACSTGGAGLGAAAPLSVFGITLMGLMRRRRESDPQNAETAA
jgi:hypothetical protein